jgi:hypothetical protein
VRVSKGIKLASKVLAKHVLRMIGNGVAAITERRGEGNQGSVAECGWSRSDLSSSVVVQALSVIRA